VVDFQALRTATLRGRVEDISGAALANVAVALSGDRTAATATNEEGEFSFEVVEGGAYTVTPNRAGFTFTAPLLSLEVPGDGATVNFTAVRGSFRRYFSEGATGDFFDTELALVNPTAATANVVARFEGASGAAASKTLVIGPYARSSLDPGSLPGFQSAEFSTVIDSDVPIVADRTMTWDASGYGSHTETSIAAPRTLWYLAEGATTGDFDLFYLLHNPGTQTARVSVKYLLPAPQPPLVKEYDVAGQSRLTIWVDQEHPSLQATDVSAVITSTNNTPIIVERAMYLSAPGQVFSAGHEGAGVPEPATRWFLAEGATGTFFDTFVLIANPGPDTASVGVDYLLPDGTVVSKRYDVAGGSRFNIWVDLEDPRLADTAVSTRLTSLNGVPIVVERAMWWIGPDGRWQEGHDSAGATRSGTKWVVAGGESGGARHAETFVLVANTSSSETQVRVSVLLEDGAKLEQQYAVLPNSRFTIPVGELFPGARDHRYGVIVESVGPGAAQIVVERATYSDAVDANGRRVVWAAGGGALGTRVR
jgi:hypothetical protein